MTSTQLVISHIEEDILTARLKHVRRLLDELVHDVEARTLGREEFLEQVKDVERLVRQLRQKF